MVKETINQGGHYYEAPSVEIMEAVSEGVFCTSSFGVKDWEEEQDHLNFN